MPDSTAAGWQAMLRTRAHEALLAVALLTRLPLPAFTPPDGLRMASAAWAFPIVGAGVGAFVAATLIGLHWIGAPHNVAAWCAVGAGLLITGALHEDGLADVADGIGGGRDVDRRLEIMRDSRIGTYGVVSLIVALAAKASALQALLTAGSDAGWLLSVALLSIAAVAAGARACLAIPYTLLSEARSDGLAVTAGRPTVGRLAIGLGLAVLLIFAALGLSAPAFLVIVCQGVAAFTVAMMARRYLGGYTGDVLGATVVVSELAGLVALAVVL